MRSIESDGESIDDAIEKALAILQVPRDRVEIEILSDASRGRFGFGGQPARVRATVRESLLSAMREEVPPPSPSGRGNSAVDRQPAGPAATHADVARAQSILEQLLGYLGVDCRVELEADVDQEGPSLHVSGADSGIVIGRRGETLDAIEYLVNRIVTRADEATGRVMIDVEHYRQRRREYLEQLAHRLADKAKQTGRPVTLNPMSPRDRRIVHLTLQDDGGVSTQSFGDGVYRKMTIRPGGRGQAPSRRGPSA